MIPVLQPGGVESGHEQTTGDERRTALLDGPQILAILDHCDRNGPDALFAFIRSSVLLDDAEPHFGRARRAGVWPTDLA